MITYPWQARIVKADQQPGQAARTERRSVVPARREAIRLLGGVVPVGTLVGCAARAIETSAPPLAPQRQWLAKLGEGLPEQHDYLAEVEGCLPEGLSGVLYRNGPGLFERGGSRKWTILDGDGMIRATTFAEGRARFRNRFVQTTKYLAETKAGKFLYPTWTTPAPSPLDNIPAIPSRSQAGVTPVIKGGVLYAFDELGPPWGLDPASLQTEREIDPYEGPPGTGPAGYKAHTKTDGATGDWILVGRRGQVSPALHVVVKDPAGRQKRHAVQPSPRASAYFHDFFWTDPYAVFHLQPALLSPLPMLAGLRTYADSLDWRPEQGSLLFVVDTTGERPPVAVEAPPFWMWHALNAYRAGDAIVADFVGYDAPDHFLGPNAGFRAIMQGRDGLANSPGTLRRRSIDLARKHARLETIAVGHYEFPFLPQQRVGRRHRYGYVAAQAADQGWFHDGLARIDTDGGKHRAFHFDVGYYVGEPVFAPDRASAADPSTPEDRGWLLAEVFEGRSETGFVAVFDAAHLEDGPVAKVRLRHHLPFSFHGWWDAA
jgi:all-trans-8'-apo-beta-carotenal 15,15'-oxygenase